MSQSATRILTTHVGSLIRPPDLLAMIEAKQDGTPVDDKAFAETLRSAVADVVRQQAEAEIDIVSDGEFGKTGSWSRYVVERLSGIEFRPGAVASISSIRGKDFRDFEDFYQEYEGEHGAAGLGKSITPAGGWAITGPIAYTGHAQIGRDIANLQAALDDSGVTDGFLPVVAPGSVLTSRTDEYYKSEEAVLFAIADALHDEYAAVVESGLMVQIDDAYSGELLRCHGTAPQPGRLPQMGSVARRCAEPCFAGDSRRALPLSRLLGELERSAHQRRATEGHRRPDPAGQCRRIFVGNGKPAA